MNILFTVYVFALFFVLTPGVLITLPRKGSKIIVALVHGLIFSTILAMSGHYVWKFSNSIFEGAQTQTPPPIKMPRIQGIEDDIKKNNLVEAEKKINNLLKNKTLPESRRGHLNDMIVKIKFFNDKKLNVINELTAILNKIKDEKPVASTKTEKKNSEAPP